MAREQLVDDAGGVAQLLVALVVCPGRVTSSGASIRLGQVREQPRALIERTNRNPQRSHCFLGLGVDEHGRVERVAELAAEAGRAGTQLP